MESSGICLIYLTLFIFVQLSAKAAAARAAVPLPPIRNKVDVQKHMAKVKKGDIFDKSDAKENTKKMQETDKEGKLKRDITPMFDYYKAWDKFTNVSILTK